MTKTEVKFKVKKEDIEGPQGYHIPQIGSQTRKTPIKLFVGCEKGIRECF